PRQIPDLLALHGDHIDNIPGVTGVGHKTAQQLLSAGGDIEELARNELPSNVRFRGRNEILRRIRQNIESVRISRQLATICCQVPIEISPDILRYRRADHSTLDPLCHEL